MCREEGSNTPTMALVKWFSQEREEDWEREVSMHLNMSQKGGHPCVLPYVWHSKGENTVLYRLPQDEKSIEGSISLVKTFFICLCIVGFEISRRENYRTENVTENLTVKVKNKINQNSR